jgi:hypothetical protein
MVMMHVRFMSAALVSLLVTVGFAGGAQAVAPAKDKPGKPASDDRPGKPVKPDGPAKPAKPAKGGESPDIRRTQTVFVCSYVCPEDGSPCVWAIRAETRPLPVPAPVED